jgi:hypothetical protein
MSGQVQALAGQRVFVCDADGPCLAEYRALTDLIGELFSAQAPIVAIPLARLGPDFLRLSSGVAGEVLQKLVNYQRTPVVVGDVTEASEKSAPLRDFIRESNRGRMVWFVDDLAALETRLAAG